MKKDLKSIEIKKNIKFKDKLKTFSISKVKTKKKIRLKNIDVNVLTQNNEPLGNIDVSHPIKNISSLDVINIDIPKISNIELGSINIDKPIYDNIELGFINIDKPIENIKTDIGNVYKIIDITKINIDLGNVN